MSSSYAEASLAQNSEYQAHACATISLLTPGRVLHLSALLILKRYRDKGNKAGAVKGYQLLQQEGLGELVEIKPQRGASIVCTTVNSSCMAVCPVCTISEVPINLQISLLFKYRLYVVSIN